MRTARKLRLFLLDLFYPNRCPCCRQMIAWNQYLCENCRMLVTIPETEFCPFCGKIRDSCICEDTGTFDAALTVTVYTDFGRVGVLSLKKAENLHFAYYCGEVLAARILQHPVLKAYDLIVPVPMAKRTKRKRCCNPAEVLAKEISSETRIPVHVDLLKNNDSGVSQHTLSFRERQENVKQFTIQPIDLTGLRVILCDDVLTTGSTLRRCASLLREQGAENVAIAVMTSTRYHNAARQNEKSENTLGKEQEKG